MAGINYKSFKKTHTDDNYTTLQHANGHVLKIAHSKLSPNLKKDLDALPIHKACGGGVKMYADSDEPVSKDDNAPTTQAAQTPAQIPNININLGGVGQAPPNGVPAALAPNGTPGTQDVTQYSPPQAQGKINFPAGTLANEVQARNRNMDLGKAPDAPAQKPLWGSGSEDQSQMDNTDDQQQPDQSGAQDQSAQQQAPNQTAQPATFNDHKAAAFQNIQNEMGDFKKDLEMGAIKPETYQQLMGKGPLGKIGSIFGLIIGSAGAGLSHQPNQLLEMMNNEIKNNLDSQVKTQENARNLYQMNLQHQMQNSQIGLNKIEAQRRAYELSNMQSNQIALHDLVQQSKNIKDPAQAQRAQQALMFISQGVNNENYKIADRAAAAQAYGNMLLGNGQQQSGDPEQSFQNRQKMLNMMGDKGSEMSKFETERHIPGVSSNSSIPLTNEQRSQLTAMNVLDDKGKDLLGYIKQHTGSWNPSTRATATQKIEEMKNFYNDSIKGGALSQGRLGWYDEQFAKNPTDILPQLMGSTAKLNEMVKSNANRRDLLLKSTGAKPMSPARANVAPDKAAMQWAKNNPNDPRAQKILKTNGQ